MSQFGYSRNCRVGQCYVMCRSTFSLFFRTSVVWSGWPAIRRRTSTAPFVYKGPPDPTSTSVSPRHNGVLLPLKSHIQWRKRSGYPLPLSRAASPLAPPPPPILLITYFRTHPAISLFVNINPLGAKFFRGNINIYIHFVISPHWYDAGCCNPSSNKTRTYLFYLFNIMAADVLAT